MSKPVKIIKIQDIYNKRIKKLSKLLNLTSEQAEIFFIAGMKAVIDSRKVL